MPLPDIKRILQPWQLLKGFLKKGLLRELCNKFFPEFINSFYGIKIV
jgi:hypothetical protein